MKRFFRVFSLIVVLGVLVLPLSAKNSSKGTGKSSDAPKNNTKNNIYNPQPGDDVLDLSSYKIIDEVKTKELSKRLNDMVNLHNKRLRKSSTNRAPAPSQTSKDCLDIGSLGVISAKAKHRLQEELQQLIRIHNQQINIEAKKVTLPPVLPPK